MKALKFKDKEETRDSFEDEEHLKYEFGDETDVGTPIDDAIAILVVSLAVGVQRLPPVKENELQRVLCGRKCFCLEIRYGWHVDNKSIDLFSFQGGFIIIIIII